MTRTIGAGRAIRQRAAQTLGEMAAIFEAMGLEIAQDVRTGRPVRTDGDAATPLDDDALALHIVRSRDHGPVHLPPNRGAGNDLWRAWFAEHPYDAFRSYLERCERELDPDLEADADFDPANLPDALWPGRVGSPDDIELVRWCWRAMFMALVFRAFEAPVSFDILPILFSRQGGVGKTRAVNQLVPPPFAATGLPMTGVSGFDSARKRLEHISGLAIIESGEMVGHGPQHLEAVKNDLTLTTDRGTLKYDKYLTDRPRRYIMVATTNRRRMLHPDPSGYRRFIVTEIAGKRDHDGDWQPRHLERCRDLYWAYAMRLYRANPDPAQLAVPEGMADLHHAHAERYVEHGYS